MEFLHKINRNGLNTSSCFYLPLPEIQRWRRYFIIFLDKITKNGDIIDFVL